MSCGVLVLAGPTCSGKTELAIELAERFGAEIIGADSRQVYRGMPVGTAAPTPQQRARVPHHLVEMLDPAERYSAARFTNDALAIVRGLHARGTHALVAGGTGFYVRALCGDVALSPAYDERLRERLAREARVHPTDVLHAWLQTRDPARARAVSPQDRYRIVRALEIVLAPRDARSGPRDGGSSLRELGIPFAKFVLDVADPERERRIGLRVDAMLAAGFVEEAERIGPDAVAANAVGYPQALAYASGKATFAELRASLVRVNRRYAKRQRTWFRSEPGARWIAAADAAPSATAELGW